MIIKQTAERSPAGLTCKALSPPRTPHLLSLKPQPGLESAPTKGHFLAFILCRRAPHPKCLWRVFSILSVSLDCTQDFPEDKLAWDEATSEVMEVI